MRNGFKRFALVGGLTALLVGGAVAPALATHECPNDIDNWPFQWTGNKPDGTPWTPADKQYGFTPYDPAGDPQGVGSWNGAVTGVPGPEDTDHMGPLSRPILPSGTYDYSVTAGAFDLVPNVVCTHLAGADGYADMADGNPMYTFGFSDVTGVPEDEVIVWSALGAELPAPTIRVREGQEFYLTLTNVGMMLRPDLFDGHTVHWHGYPNATSMFDGLPESGIAVNMSQTFTYYYKVRDPGTFMYHCHVEVVEHMQMGMVGNFYVESSQSGPIEYPSTSGRTFTRFAYTDGDGSTGYDREYPLQVIDLDPLFHAANEAVQPLPFADMDGRLFLINGRGYPDTLSTAPMGPAAPNSGWQAQPVHSLVTANTGERVLLRLSNLGTTHFFTMTTLGLPMQVVGRDAKHLRGPEGDNLYYTTNSVTIAGGESYDVIIDTCGLDGICGGANAADDIPAGTYHLYSRMLPELNNDGMDRGGAMTEIVIN